MSTAKETKEMLRKARQGGLDVDTESRHHKVRAAADSPVLGVIPKTPGSQRSVLKSKIITERILRGEPARPESDNHGPNSPGKVVSEQAQTPAADEAAEQASTVRRADRRAQQEAEEAADAAAAERIRNKSQRKAKAAPKAEPKRREYVRPRRQRMNKYGCVTVTSPTGEPALYSTDVARKNGREVRPEDIRLAKDVIDWPTAKETGQAPTCFSCHAPSSGSSGILYYGDVRWIDRRDLHLALGKSLKHAAALATREHKLAATTGEKNGEFVSTGNMPLCERCHDKFSKWQPSGGFYEWFSIDDWPTYLDERVNFTENFGLFALRPTDPLPARRSPRRMSKFVTCPPPGSETFEEPFIL